MMTRTHFQPSLLHEIPFPVRRDIPAPQPTPPPTAEPFGQAGVLRYSWPIALLVPIFIALLSAAMWARSYAVSDSFSRPGQSSAWTVRSLYGRVIITRFSLPAESHSHAVGARRYTQMPLYGQMQDGWQDSWKKTLGLEWRRAPFSRDPAFANSDFWLRIRWPLITAVAGAIPMTIAVLHHVRREKEA